MIENIRTDGRTTPLSNGLPSFKSHGTRLQQSCHAARSRNVLTTRVLRVPWRTPCRDICLTFRQPRRPRGAIVFAVSFLVTIAGQTAAEKSRRSVNLLHPSTRKPRTLFNDTNRDRSRSHWLQTTRKIPSRCVVVRFEAYTNRTHERDA